MDSGPAACRLAPDSYTLAELTDRRYVAMVQVSDTNQRLFQGPGLAPVVLACFWGHGEERQARVEVTLGESDRLEFVLKKFRRQIAKSGLFQDMKRKRFYEAPGAQRRRKEKAAARRKTKTAHRREYQHH